MFTATLIKGRTYYFSGLSFIRDVPRIVSDEVGQALESKKNFEVAPLQKEDGNQKPDNNQAPEGENQSPVADKVVYSKAQLVEMKAEGQKKVLASFGLDSNAYKNEAERIDAILAAQAK